MDPVVMAASIIILLFSVIVHEVMHGLAALKFGDHTAKNAGRLTLNPIPHIDLMGTIFLPALLIFSGSPILFGWAKPVPVNPLHFRDIRKGELVVASAGVISNFVMAIVYATIFHTLSLFADPSLFTAMTILTYAVYINLVLAVFNLFPIPPLDGSKILMTFLPPHLEIQMRRMEQYGFFILIALLMVPSPFGRGSLLSSILGVVVGFLRSLLGV
jgi:Zn-dependent protease